MKLKHVVNKIKYLFTVGVNRVTITTLAVPVEDAGLNINRDQAAALSNGLNKLTLITNFVLT